MCSEGRSLRQAYNLWGDPEFLWGATLGKEGQAPPTSSFLPYSGYYAMRSGWKRDDLYLFFDAGPVGTGHWHEDMLNLLLRDFNRSLLAKRSATRKLATWRRNISRWIT